MNKQGVSMLEVLVVIAILAIVFSISSTGYINWRRQVSLINNKEEFRSTLIKAQQLATAAAENDNWGVHLEDDNYILFRGSFFNELDPNNEIKNLTGVHILNASTILSDGIGGHGSDVVFSKFTGQTANTGTVYFIFSENSSTTQSVDIKSSGRIN